MAIADTGFLVDLARGTGSRARKSARRRIRDLVDAGETLATTRFNVAELLVGVARATDARAERRKVENLLRPFSILEFDARAAEAFGRIVGRLQKQGTPIGDMDALISAVALDRGHAVVTRNTRHFRRVPGLEVVTY